jgi:hypothetical protein
VVALSHGALDPFGTKKSAHVEWVEEESALD